MNFFRSTRSKNQSYSKPNPSMSPNQENPEPRNPKEELLIQIPACTVHLIEEGESVELAKGDFTLIRLIDDTVFLATVVKVGDDLHWPLTKDEPVVKLDALHYLFSLPMNDGDLLSYGVSFSEKSKRHLGSLDLFLKEHSCFDGSSIESSVVNWQEFAPRIEDYNGALAKAIAGGTGTIVKGIFQCSNAYTKKVQKGGEMMLSRVAEEKNGVSTTERNSNKNVGRTDKSRVNKHLKRARKLSKMTEKMSKTMLNVVGVNTGSLMTPLVRSQTGKTLLAMVPGEVLLASLDSLNKVFDAAEVAEKQALTATSNVATRMVTRRFGESAGEATEDVFATAGHCAGTAWNVFKIRQAINPKSSLPIGKISTRMNKY